MCIVRACASACVRACAAACGPRKLSRVQRRAGSSATWRTTDNMQRATWHASAAVGRVGGQVSGEFKNGGIVCLSPPCKLRGMLLVEIALNRRHFTRTVRAVPRMHGRGRRLGWACSGALSGRMRRVRHWSCALLCSLHARTHAQWHARTHAQWHAGFGRGRRRNTGARITAGNKASR